MDLRVGEEAAIVALETSRSAQSVVTVLGEARRLPAGRGSVRGRILGPKRRPVEGARVTLSSAGGVLVALSNPAGEYAFDNVPAGRFRVRASRSGLATRESRSTGAGYAGTRRGRSRG